jgi:hypothetical protein
MLNALLLVCPLLAAQHPATSDKQLVWGLEEVPATKLAPNAATAALPEGWSHHAPLNLGKRQLGSILRDSTGWKHCVLRVDGLGPEFDEVSASPIDATKNGSHLAYTARRNGKSFVVHDERQIELPDGAIEQLALSPDGTHVAYVQRRGSHVAIGLDGTDLVARSAGVLTLPPEQGSLWCFFPPGGSSPAFAAYGEKALGLNLHWSGATERARIAIDLASLVFSPDGQRLAYSADGERVVVLGAGAVSSFPAQRAFSSSLVFSPDSRRVAWADERGVFIDGELLREERADSNAQFANSGSRFRRSLLWLPDALEPSYVARLAKGAAFRKDGKLWREADEVRVLPQSVDLPSGRVAVEVRRNNAKTWMVDDLPGELFHDVGPIAFASDGLSVFCGLEAPPPQVIGLGGGAFEKHGSRFGQRDPLEGALERLEGGGARAATPVLWSMHHVVIGGRKSDLPQSLDLAPPSVAPGGGKIAFRTATGLSPDRTRVISPGVCVVDLAAAPPTPRIYSHDDAIAIGASLAFSADNLHVAYLVFGTTGVTVAVDGVCVNKSYAGFANHPRFTEIGRIEATALQKSGTATKEIPLVLTLREAEVGEVPALARTTPTPVASAPELSKAPIAQFDARAEIAAIVAADPDSNAMQGVIKLRSSLEIDLANTFGCAVLPRSKGTQGAFGHSGPQPFSYELHLRSTLDDRWSARCIGGSAFGGAALSEGSCDGTTVWIRPYETQEIAASDGKFRRVETPGILRSGPRSALNGVPRSLWSPGYGQGLSPARVVADIDRRTEWLQREARTVLGARTWCLIGKPRKAAWSDLSPHYAKALSTVDKIELSSDASSRWTGLRLSAGAKEVLDVEVAIWSSSAAWSADSFRSVGEPGEKALRIEEALAELTGTNSGSVLLIDASELAAGPTRGPCIHPHYEPLHPEGHIRLRPCPVCDYQDKIEPMWAAVQTNSPVREWIECTTDHGTLASPTPCTHYVVRPTHPEGDANGPDNVPLLASEGAKWPQILETQDPKALARSEYFFEAVTRLHPPIAIHLLERQFAQLLVRRQQSTLNGARPSSRWVDPLLEFQLKLLGAAAKIGATAEGLCARILEDLGDRLDLLSDGQREPLLHALLLSDPHAIRRFFPVLVSQLALMKSGANAERFLRGPVDKVSSTVIWNGLIDEHTIGELIRAERDARSSVVSTWATNVLKSCDREKGNQWLRSSLERGRDEARGLLEGRWWTTRSDDAFEVDVSFEGGECVGRVVGAGRRAKSNILVVGKECFRMRWSPSVSHPALPLAYYRSTISHKNILITSDDIEALVESGAIRDETEVTRSDWTNSYQRRTYAQFRDRFPPSRVLLSGPVFVHSGANAAIRERLDAAGKGAQGGSPAATIRSVAFLTGDDLEFAYRDGESDYRGGFSLTRKRDAPSKPQKRVKR